MNCGRIFALIEPFGRKVFSYCYDTCSVEQSTSLAANADIVIDKEATVAIIIVVIPLNFIIIPPQ